MTKSFSVIVPLMTVLICCVGRADEPGIMAKTGLSLHDPDLLILLGQTRRIEEPEQQGRTLAYEVQVVFEFRAALKEGERLRMVMPLLPSSPNGMRGGAGLPEFSHNKVYLLTARKGSPGNLLFQHPVDLPIGMRSCDQVKEEDIPLIKIALAKLAEIAKTKYSIIDRFDAAKLLETRDNYYLWAIGATALAAWDDEHAASELEKVWMSPSPSAPQYPLPTPRQILWLEHCFRAVMSEGVAPSTDVRHGMLLYYFRKASEEGPSTAPSR